MVLGAVWMVFPLAAMQAPISFGASSVVGVQAMDALVAATKLFALLMLFPCMNLVRWSVVLERLRCLSFKLRRPFQSAFVFILL